MKKYLLLVALALASIITLLTNLGIITKVLVVLICAFCSFEVMQMRAEDFDKKEKK